MEEVACFLVGHYCIVAVLVRNIGAVGRGGFAETGRVDPEVRRSSLAASVVPLLVLPLVCDQDEPDPEGE